MSIKDAQQIEAKLFMDLMAFCVIVLTIVATWLFNNFNSAPNLKYVIAIISALILFGTAYFLRSKANNSINELSK